MCQDNKATPQIGHAQVRKRPIASSTASGRSPTPALHPGPASPRLLPTAHRRAGGPTPPDPRPRRPGRAAAGPGLIAPCPSAGSSSCSNRPRSASGNAARTQLDPLRQVRASHPFSHAHQAPPRRPDRSSARRVAAPSAPGAPGGRPAREPELLPPWATAWHRGEHPRHAPPPPSNAAPTVHCRPQNDYGSSVERTAKLHPLWREHRRVARQEMSGAA